jgi:ferredoxin
VAHTIKIDKQLCLGSGRCIDELPRAFAESTDGLAEPTPLATGTPLPRLLEAARLCPGVAITVYDEGGAEIDL